MCLLVVAHQVDEARPLLLLANRDEYYARPTAPAGPWRETPGLLAGRDLVAGGTWLGARRKRWAAVTNYRQGLDNRAFPRSRGWLVRDYLQEDMPPEEYLSQVLARGDAYAGFNLLLGNGRELWYGSNRRSGMRQLPPGLYGLSNHLLDTPWPKVDKVKAALADALQQCVTNEQLLGLMVDTERTEDDALPETGVPLAWEKALSAMFIITPDYGTRSTSLLAHRDNGTGLFIERSYKKGPDVWAQRRFEVP